MTAQIIWSAFPSSRNLFFRYWGMVMESFAAAEEVILLVAVFGLDEEDDADAEYQKEIHDKGKNLCIEHNVFSLYL